MGTGGLQLHRKRAKRRIEAAWKRHEQSGRPLPPRRPARPQWRRPVEARPQATGGSDPAKSGEPPYPRLLILDKLGYLPLSREEASLFFRLLVRRYERGSLIVTSNKSFADWSEVFNDQVLATAILDRLLRHATTVNIQGESYRLREKRKAGLLGRRAKTPDGNDEGEEGDRS